MATHSSILAWKIPGTEEPGGLRSMGLQRVRHNWATNTFTMSNFFNPILEYLPSSPYNLCEVSLSVRFPSRKLNSDLYSHDSFS